MHSPYGIEIIEQCQTCQRRGSHYFCAFPIDLLRDFEALKYATVFPKGAILYVEGQAPRGVFMLCTGRVKLSISSTDGKALITQIAEAGELLGLSAAISGKPYEVTAETLAPCQINFIKRDEIVRFLAEHNLACMHAAEQLSHTCRQSHQQARSLGLANSAASKLAQVMLEWGAQFGKADERGVMLKLSLTHEEIAQLIGASRETVTRLFSEFKRQQLIYVKGATLILCNQEALQALSNS
ncbi:MAG: Crp/Fnr family transcriptional regulator [Acidobacteria bacterium]|nr:Crp/Fnr family transcriptional regulator [Acidobacteriota bacterium]